jgi:hypothetical protein
MSATITITCDNDYYLWFTGQYIGAMNHEDGLPIAVGWDVPESWAVNLQNGGNVIAVWGLNWEPMAGGQGMILEISLDDGTVIVTDNTWRVETDSIAGWTQFGFDDSGWDSPVLCGAYDAIPWTIFAPPITEFSINGAEWIWHGPATWDEGYGWKSPEPRVLFRKTFYYTGPLPVRSTTWGKIKFLYQD